MPKLHLTDSGPHLSETDLRLVESKLEIKLPSSYRRFLLRNNGGTPDKIDFEWTRNEKSEPGWLYDFLTLGDASEPFDATKTRNSVWWQAHRYRRWLPDGCIPIASGPDLHLVLFTRGTRRGQVWMRYWDDYTDDNPETALYFVAKSFAALLDVLAESPPEGTSET